MGPLHGAPPDGSPPVRIPVELCDDYTSQGAVPVVQWYFDDKSDPSKSYQAFTRTQIREYMDGIRERRTFYYGDLDTWLYSALDDFPISGKSVLIVGRSDAGRCDSVPLCASFCLL